MKRVRQTKLAELGYCLKNSLCYFELSIQPCTVCGHFWAINHEQTPFSMQTFGRQVSCVCHDSDSSRLSAPWVSDAEVLTSGPGIVDPSELLHSTSQGLYLLPLSAAKGEGVLKAFQVDVVSEGSLTISVSFDWHVNRECQPWPGSSKPDWTNPGLVKFFISIYDPASCTSLNVGNQGCSSGFQLCNAGVLVENSSHIQKQTSRKVST